MKELEITKEDIELLKEMKDNCSKTNVYDDKKRLLKANAITKFLVEYEEKQELIDYLKEKIKEYEEKYNNTCVFLEQDRFETRINTYKEILSKIEKSDK